MAWVNLPSNCLHLCGDCHRWAESYRALARADGILVPISGQEMPEEVPIRDVFGRQFWLTDEGSALTYTEFHKGE